MEGGSAATGRRRRARVLGPGACAALYPAIAEAARLAGAGAVGLIDVGMSASLNAWTDRVGITYSDGSRLGEAGSAVQVPCSVVGRRHVPQRAIPQVVARAVIGPDLPDITDPGDVRRLRDCLPPGQPEAAALFGASLAVAQADPPQLLQGDAIELLPVAIGHVPGGALPVVLTTWALSRFAREKRRRFLQRLEEAAAGRAIGWASVEGVGVAPGIPALGDRPASGHSIIGVAVLDGSARRPDAVGRCWSRGRMMSWLERG